MVSLVGMGGKQYAHRIAAKTFIPNPKDKPEVNHKDGNTHNNYCGCKELNYEDSNLEWVTRKENMEHASANGLINHESLLRKITCKKNREKIDYDKMKTPVVQLTLDGEYIARFESIVEASNYVKIGKGAIRDAAAREGYHKTAGGFVWVYEKDYDPDKDYKVFIDQGSGSRKAITQYTMNEEFVRDYQSILEACKINGWTGNSYISECCNGKRRMYKNYIWKYKK